MDLQKSGVLEGAGGTCPSAVAVGIRTTNGGAGSTSSPPTDEKVDAAPTRREETARLGLRAARVWVAPELARVATLAATWMAGLSSLLGLCGGQRALFQAG